MRIQKPSGTVHVSDFQVEVFATIGTTVTLHIRVDDRDEQKNWKSGQADENHIVRIKVPEDEANRLLSDASALPIVLRAVESRTSQETKQEFTLSKVSSDPRNSSSRSASSLWEKPLFWTAAGVIVLLVAAIFALFGSLFQGAGTERLRPSQPSPTISPSSERPSADFHKFIGTASEPEQQTELTVENLQKICPKDVETASSLRASLPSEQKVVRYSGVNNGRQFQGQILYDNCGSPSQDELLGTFTRGQFLSNGEFEEVEPECRGKVKTVIPEDGRGIDGTIKRAIFSWKSDKVCTPNSYPEIVVSVERQS
jgi:hypothetical protein